MSKAKRRLAFWVIVTLAGVMLDPLHADAGIPEPGIILYGQVFDDTQTLVTSGEITWTFTPTGGGGDVVTVATNISEIQGTGGPYSYAVMVPCETAVTDFPVSSNTMPLDPSGIEYERVGQVTGTSISRTDMVVISLADRGTAQRVSIGLTSADSDGDGMLDVWEQQIIDADPFDNINTFLDVRPGDDFDGDGENNGVEHDNDTDPTDPMSATRGDVNGDKIIDMDDAFLALKAASGMATVGTGITTAADVNGDNRIGMAEVDFILQRLSGVR